MMAGRRPARHIPRDKPLNIAGDGNSLAAVLGSATYPSLASMVAARITALGIFPSVTSSSRAVAGQDISNMTANANANRATGTSIDNDYRAGKTNILLLWETTNAFHNGTASAANGADPPGGAVSLWQTYLPQRLSYNPGWLPVMLGTLPRNDGQGAQADIDQLNGWLVETDRRLKGMGSTFGVRRFVDVRASTPFALRDYLPTTFMENPGLWYPAPVRQNANGSANPSGASTGSVHLVDAGYAYVAEVVTRAIINMAGL